MKVNIEILSLCAILLYATPLMAANTITIFFGNIAFSSVGLIFLSGFFILVFFNNKKKKYFIIQIADLEKKNKKIKEQIATFGKNEEQISKKKIQTLKNNLEDMAINYKALQNSLELTKHDSLRNSVLLSNLGHSIRTNLNGIIGFSILLENEFALNEDAELFDYTQDIKQSGESLMYLLNNIIDISRIEANTFTLKQEECDLKLITEDVIREYKHKADEKKLTIVFQDEGVPIFTSDTDVLKHVFVNLLDNAIKFTEKGYVKISTSFNVETQKIEWFIKDTGVGIDKAYLPDIFEPYRQYSLGYSKKKFQGIGLGLPLVKKLLEKIHATINIESEKAVGTFVKVVLPYIIEKSKVSVSDNKFNKNHDLKETGKLPDVELYIDKLNILVVEPEKFDGMLLKKMLSNAGTVFLAVNRDEALRHVELFNIKSLTFDIIFIELNINNIQGEIALMEKIKSKNKNYSKIPFVAISSFPQINEKDEVLAQGFNAYIAKPIIKSNLIKIINNLFIQHEFN